MARLEGKIKQVTQKDVESKSVSHDWEGLRNALFQEINLLRANLVPIARARTVAILAKRIIDGAALEYAVKNHLDGGQVKKMLKEQ